MVGAEDYDAGDKNSGISISHVGGWTGDDATDANDNVNDL